MCSGDPDGGRAVDGSVVYVPCPNGVTAVKVSTTPPYLTQLWTDNDGAAGGPIIAGGLIWTIGGDNAVHGLNPANGHEVISIPFGGDANHFPTPAVGDGLLLLPGTDQVIAFMGPAGLPPPPPPPPPAILHSSSWLRHRHRRGRQRVRLGRRHQPRRRRLRHLPLERQGLGRSSRRGGHHRRGPSRQPLGHQLGPPHLPSHLGRLGPVPGSATDIAVGANGSVWVVGTNPVAGGYGIYHWNGNGWAAVAGGAVTIAVDPAGNPWVTNSAHHIYHHTSAGWALYPGSATDIAVGANGSVWVVGTNPVAGGYGIYQWNGKAGPQCRRGGHHRRRPSRQPLGHQLGPLHLRPLNQHGHGAF